MLHQQQKWKRQLPETPAGPAVSGSSWYWPAADVRRRSAAPSFYPLSTLLLHVCFSPLLLSAWQNAICKHSIPLLHLFLCVCVICSHALTHIGEVYVIKQMFSIKTLWFLKSDFNSLHFKQLAESWNKCLTDDFSMWNMCLEDQCIADIIELHYIENKKLAGMSFHCLRDIHKNTWFPSNSWEIIISPGGWVTR